MYQQSSEFLYAVSHRLSSILDRVGFSPEDRESKVMIATKHEIFRYIEESFLTHRSVFMFGSRGEGSTGPGLNSDIDYLYQNIDYEIVVELSGCQVSKIYLYMLQDGHTHPGYVKLQLIRILPDNTYVPLHHSYCKLDSFGVSVLPNTSFHVDDIGYRAGPAVREQKDSICCDHVRALRCSQWPREGYEWVHRRRLYDWPKPRQIQNTLKYGCFATPVGHPNSNEEHLEWRLSFSIAERDLVRSFEDTVMKVYILLKMVKKTFIEPILGDGLSSYHCKVCMLWMRESTPSELWCTENLLWCLILCIRQLHEWAIAGFCPDYFIVLNNIFDRKIVGTVRMRLVQVLERLLSDDFRFLCRIECCHIGRLLVDDLSSIEHYRLEFVTEVVGERLTDYSLCVSRATSCRTTILRTILQHYQELTYYLPRFAHAYNNAPYVMQYPLKHITMILLSQLGFYFASYLLALTSECLYNGMNSDATSVRLKLCGLGIVLENYDLTEICLQDICENRMRYMFSTSPSIKNGLSLLKCNTDSSFEKCLNVRFTIEELLENQVSYSVVYLPTETSITPIPLRVEMYRSIGTPLGVRDEDKYFWYDWAVVDSTMCLYFFQYLNFSRQGKDRHKQVAMDNMIHLIKTEPTNPHKDTALNVLSYCYMQDNQPIKAFCCLRESLKNCPHHNAAKFFVGLLFKKSMPLA
ncbi:hypothetical protein ACJMK2_028911 [Sinanodonta woodiana]|uniref:Mab-21-like HhH/H2TH-like domain-containing protein n=1 Tax=Sinanodonta woodiana TaxID=1069815 RepID=A0ABD3XAI9_SINWO